MFQKETVFQKLYLLCNQHEGNAYALPFESARAIINVMLA